MLARAHTWLDRHPVAGDAGLAAVLLAFALGTLGRAGGDGSAGAVACTVASIAPLVLRRRAPVAVFAAVMAVGLVQLAVADELLGANAAGLVALYTLVAYAPRRVAAAGAAVAVVGAALLTARFAEEQPVLTFGVLCGHLLLAALLGDRRRQALEARAGVEERARALAGELEHQAELATALERARIARELHDVVAHALAVVVAQADGGRYARDTAAAQDALATIGRTAREALAEMRRALGALDDGAAPRTPAPGADQLAPLVERLRAAGLPVTLVEEGAPRPLSPAASLTVYRLVQEALTNVLKHAGHGAAATVRLDWAADGVTLTVRDDGAGPGAADGRGRGLAGMRARVEPRGGTFSAGPRPGGGFEVRATLPEAAP